MTKNAFLQKGRVQYKGENRASPSPSSILQSKLYKEQWNHKQIYWMPQMKEKFLIYCIKIILIYYFLN